MSIPAGWRCRSTCSTRSAPRRRGSGSTAGTRGCRWRPRPPPASRGRGDRGETRPRDHRHAAVHFRRDRLHDRQVFRRRERIQLPRPRRRDDADDGCAQLGWRLRCSPSMLIESSALNGVIGKAMTPFSCAPGHLVTSPCAYVTVDQPASDQSPSRIARPDGLHGDARESTIATTPLRGLRGHRQSSGILAMVFRDGVPTGERY